MNINLTLIGQSITFLIFVWFCMKFVWPPIMNALTERKQKIADDLAAGEKGKRELELSKKRAAETMHKAKDRAADIVSHAEKRAGEVADEGKIKAKEEADHILINARNEIEQEVNHAREELRKAVAALAISGAGKILEKEIDEKAHAQLVDDLVKQL
jgi:F-type H+-transporting ATPase subunit b